MAHGSACESEGQRAVWCWGILRWQFEGGLRVRRGNDGTKEESHLFGWIALGVFTVTLLAAVPSALAWHGPTGCQQITGTTIGEVINGTNGCDHINAGAGGDIVSGRDGRDGIHGENGFDNLHGNNYDDTIYGDAGSDDLDGGNGTDTCVGGADLDFFYACEYRTQ